MKLIRIVVAVFMVAILAIAWITQLSSTGTDLSEFNSLVEKGDKAFKKTYYQEAYLAYNDAIKISSNLDVQNKAIKAYTKRYDETKEGEDLEALIAAYENAYGIFPKEASFYENAMKLKISNNDYSSALDTYKAALDKHVGSDKIDGYYDEIRYYGVLNSVGYKNYKDPVNGYYTVEKEVGWCVSKFTEETELLMGYNVLGRVGEDDIVYSEDFDGKREFIDLKKIVRGKVKKNIKEAGVYSDGLAPVKINNEYLYVDLDGKKVSGSYKFAGTYSDSKAAVQIKKDKWALVDKEGKTVSDNFEDIVLALDDSYKNSKGVAVAKKGGKYAVYSADLKSVKKELDCDKIDKITNDGVFAAKKGDKWGFVNTNGEWVIEPQYKNAKSFSNGLAAVETDNGWNMVNSSNKKVLKDSYSDIGYLDDDGNCLVMPKTDSDGETRELYDVFAFKYFDLFSNGK
jgi:hypothetical protein